MTDKPIPTCATCRWFMPADETGPMNFCRRFPPAAVPLAIKQTGEIKIHFTFAVVSGNHACGEHTPQTEAEA